MEKESVKIPNKYLFWGILAALIVLSYLILKPYFVPIISSFILAYLARPVYKTLSKKIGKTASALTCISMIILIIIIPLTILIGGIIQQASSYIQYLDLDSIQEIITHIPLLKTLNIDVQTILQNGASIIGSLFANALSYIPSLVISLLITVIGTYYILVDWDSLVTKLMNFIPLPDKEKTISELNAATRGIIHGNLLVGLIEFIVATAGFMLLGIDYYLLWATVILFTSFIPGIGPGIVWVPLSIFYFIQGDITSAVGIIVIGFGIIGILIDNILRNKIVGKTSNIHPFIMLLGVFGGVTIFGVFGFIVGPLVLVYAVKLLNGIIKNRD